MLDLQFGEQYNPYMLPKATSEFDSLSCFDSGWVIMGSAPASVGLPT